MLSLIKLNKQINKKMEKRKIKPVWVSEELHKELMLFKLKKGFKNLEEVLKHLINLNQNIDNLKVTTKEPKDLNSSVSI
jgi:hypothetical protein